MKNLLCSLALVLLVGATVSGAQASRMICAMTGTVMDSCCCVVKDGAMVCSLTGETVSSCCCSSAD